MGLEEKVVTHGTIRRLGEYLLPLITTYDAAAEAAKLVADKEDRALQQAIRFLSTTQTRHRYDHEDEQRYMQRIVAEQLNATYHEQSEEGRSMRRLYAFAKIADTLDRFTSTAGLALESLLTSVGLSVGVNIAEETVELLTKAPFYFQLNQDTQNRHRIKELLQWEIGTSLIPGIGDAYDILTNMYMTAATAVITEHGRNAIVEKYVARTIDVYASES